PHGARTAAARGAAPDRGRILRARARPHSADARARAAAWSDRAQARERLMKSTPQTRPVAAAAWTEPPVDAGPTGLDAAIVREEFPMFRTPREKPLRYLDSAATSQKPDAVLAAMDRYYAGYNANIHRGIYAIAEQATAAYEDTRRKLAGFIHAASPREIVFTRNSTEAINLVAHSWGRSRLRAGDAILLTEMEHHSNIVPW